MYLFKKICSKQSSAALNLPFVPFVSADLTHGDEWIPYWVPYCVYKLYIPTVYHIAKEFLELFYFVQIVAAL